MGNLKIKLIVISMFVMMLVTVIKADSKYEGIKEMLKNMAEDCMRNTSASEAEIENIVKRRPSETKEGKCLRLCIMVQFEIMEEGTGKFNDAGINKIITMMSQNENDKKEKFKTIYEVCRKAAENEEDHCDRAEMYVNCCEEEVKRHDLSIDYE